ncbi:MAG: hypothetical protein KIT36_10600 [Alphaproteobacteria bacterium]|nr:hypothetical protein [Alphaproteobacteria bacterium]
MLRSIGEALDAAGRRIEEISDRRNAADERDRLLALMQVLASAEASPTEADLQSAKLGIKGFVLYVHRRTADGAAGQPLNRRDVAETREKRLNH